MKNKALARNRRHLRVRKKIRGSAERPRICVFRSLKHIYVQAINDEAGVTIASASTQVADLPATESELSGKRKSAKAVGKLIAERLKAKGVSQAVFDRGGYVYHGRVAALADGVREGGIQM